MKRKRIVILAIVATLTFTAVAAGPVQLVGACDAKGGPPNPC